MNINKYISNSGYASRRQADRLIKAGKVKINGHLAKVIDKVQEKDIVTVNNQTLTGPTSQKIYLAFNKPYGVISTTDQNSDNNIMQYIKLPERVYPIGRLDVKSTGLILLTNDGEIVNQILKSKKVEKEYLVQVDKNLSEGFLRHLQEGIILDGYPTLPAKVNKISSRSFTIILLEGRKRQIRRMCEKFKFTVTKLQRTRIGKIFLTDIPEGQYKFLPSGQIKNLLGLE